MKLGRGLVAPKASDDKTRGRTTPDEIASESKKAYVKQAMREETERLVKEALERKTLTVKQGKDSYR